MKKSYRKVAVFYEAINQWGGAEKVLLDILKIFPHADLFTLIHKPVKWLPKNIKVFTPPLFFKKYDLVISTGAHITHWLNADVYYFHNINRHLYNNKFLRIFGFIDKLFLRKNKLYLCNSQTVQTRLKHTFGIDAKIVYPGIDIKKYIPKYKKPQDYYLIVSRFVPYKKVDLAILACQELGKKLIVVGQGRQEKYLNKIANTRYVNFVKTKNEDELISLYQNCKAFIFPQYEDLGLTAIESQACGRPVIAYNKGGALETVIDNKTGLYFNKQTIESLKDAILKFEKKTFKSIDCHKNSLKFSSSHFMLNFNKLINDYLKK